MCELGAIARRTTERSRVVRALAIRFHPGNHSTDRNGAPLQHHRNHEGGGLRLRRLLLRGARPQRALHIGVLGHAVALRLRLPLRLLRPAEGPVARRPSRQPALEVVHGDESVEALRRRCNVGHGLLRHVLLPQALVLLFLARPSRRGGQRTNQARLLEFFLDGIVEMQEGIADRHQRLQIAQQSLGLGRQFSRTHLGSYGGCGGAEVNWFGHCVA
mmetsp:Transcript_171185/g.548753  ORF Transcript_171185/g.548753 Transcript_171185/m.548753 type:complete len:216 (+) Transcript_171185:877-1524(+)